MTLFSSCAAARSAHESASSRRSASVAPPALALFQLAVCLLFGSESAYPEQASRSVALCCVEYAREWA